MKTMRPNMIATFVAGLPLSARSNRRTGDRGLTLIELVVAVTLLSIMILCFGTVISQASKVVTVGENTIRANAAAAAISQIIKNDFRQISKNGFLCITQSVQGNQARVFFTIAGNVNSLTGGPSGNGAIVGFGLDTTDTLFWRAAWVLNNCDKATPQIAPSAILDSLPLDLADIQKMPRYDTSKANATSLRGMDYYTLIRALEMGSANAGIPTNPTLAPRIGDLSMLANSTTDSGRLQQLNTSWKYLGQMCSNLSIQWTPDGVNWYGLSQVNTGNPPAPSSPSYTSQTSLTGTTALTNSGYPNIPEFKTAGLILTQLAYYRAMWAHDNQANWPKAVKLTFNNGDTSLTASGATSVPYEVMCLVGK